MFPWVSGVPCLPCVPGVPLCPLCPLCSLFPFCPLCPLRLLCPLCPLCPLVSLVSPVSPMSSFLWRPCPCFSYGAKTLMGFIAFILQNAGFFRSLRRSKDLIFHENKRSKYKILLDQLRKKIVLFLIMNYSNSSLIY